MLRGERLRRIDSIVIMALLFLGLFVFTSTVQPVKAQGTIYVMPDGSIDPSTANITTSDKFTYTFTGNNYLPIVVERSNIIIDGRSYTHQTSANENGFSLYGVNNVTIKNTIIANSYNGIDLESSSGNVLSGNNVTGNSNCGIYLLSSDGNTLSGNNVTASMHQGIFLGSSSHNTLSGNKATANNWDGISLHSFSDGNTLSSNQVTGNGATGDSSTAGIQLVASSKNTITGNEVHTNKAGDIKLYDSSSYNVIFGNNVSGGNDLVEVWESSDNTVIGNNITNGKWNGIYVAHTSNTVVVGNRVTEIIGPSSYLAGAYGIAVEDCLNTTVSGNYASANSGDGISFIDISDSTVVGNNLTENGYSGIEFSASSGNIIFSNRIEDNSAGLRFANTLNNVIYHNSFIGNIVQVSTDSASVSNAWNSTYPSGGNYWSDYTGVDEKSSPYQNVTGSDGIGDMPYVIDDRNRDNYPLMNVYASLGLSVSILPVSTTLYVGQSQTFASSVSGGTGPFSYQWYVNGATVLGAITSTFTYTASASDVGSVTIYVRVTDSAIVPVTAQSNTVSITVTPPSTGSAFGKTTVGTIADANPLPTMQVQRFQLTENGTVSKLTVYVSSTSSPCNIVGVIYADNAGVPSTLVAQTPITNVAGAAGWYNLTFSSPVSLTAGYYHLGWLSGASTTLTTYYDAGGTHTWNTGLQASAPFYPTPPNPFVVERQNAYTFSIYATYTPSPSTGSTFGKTTVGTIADANPLPTMQVQRFQLTENGTVSKLTVYVSSTSSPCNIVGVIYADNAGVPSTLVAQTPITNVAGAAGWYNLTFSSPVSLTAGYYHLGWLSGASTTLTTYYDAGGTHTWNTGAQQSAPFYPTPPNPFVVERQNAYTFSIYATYTPSP